MPRPAENAATVREALDFSKGVTGPEQIQEALVALAALLAQAEAGDRFSERAFDQQKARAEAAEADRDAAVREQERLQGFCERYDAWMLKTAKVLGWERDDWHGQDPAIAFNLADAAVRERNELLDERTMYVQAVERAEKERDRLLKAGKTLRLMVEVAEKERDQAREALREVREMMSAERVDLAMANGSIYLEVIDAALARLERITDSRHGSASGGSLDGLAG